jgi:predicted nuclease of predicted toxin-antitoxin system
MRFKVDENLPAEIAKLLQLAGHDAVTVLDQQLGGEADSTLIALCRMKRRALVTLDMDFADIRTYAPNKYSGLIVLRLRRQDKPSTVDVMSRLLAKLLEQPLDGHLWIVDEKRVRIR